MIIKAIMRLHTDSPSIYIRINVKAHNLITEDHSDFANFRNLGRNFRPFGKFSKIKTSAIKTQFRMKSQLIEKNPQLREILTK